MGKGLPHTRVGGWNAAHHAAIGQRVYPTRAWAVGALCALRAGRGRLPHTRVGGWDVRRRANSRTIRLLHTRTGGWPVALTADLFAAVHPTCARVVGAAPRIASMRCVHPTRVGRLGQSTSISYSSPHAGGNAWRLGEVASCNSSLHQCLIHLSRSAALAGRFYKRTLRVSVLCAEGACPHSPSARCRACFAQRSLPSRDSLR